MPGMMRSLKCAAILIAVGFFHSIPAWAASFDCSLARSPDEVAVCGNARLSALDSEMGGLWYAYSRVPLLMGANGNRNDEAQAFLARRRACGSNVLCLSDAYQARLTTLRGEIDSSLAQFATLQNGN